MEFAVDLYASNEKEVAGFVGVLITRENTAVRYTPETLAY